MCEAYRECGIPAEVYPFIENMPEMFARADLVISRSGAAAVAELAAAGKASILISFPAAADHHQFANALVMEGLGTARLIVQEELNPERLRAAVWELLKKSRNGWSRWSTLPESWRAPMQQRGSQNCSSDWRSLSAVAAADGVSSRRHRIQGTQRRTRMFGKIRKIHFVGIGGIGMSGIAEVLLNLGFTVSGSDIKITPVTDRLKMLGARIFETHAADNVHRAQVVVVSSAVTADNPETTEALRLQIPVIPRAEMLAELMRLEVLYRSSRRSREDHNNLDDRDHAG